MWLRMALFFKKAGEKKSDNSLWLHAALRQKFMLNDEEGLSISQIACAHPECGEAETAILVFKTGEKTKAYKILKPLAQITPSDLENLID
jgi:hypothetical protein